MDVEKAFDKVHHPFLIKTLSKVGGAYINITKAMYDKYSQHHTQWAKTKIFHPKIKNKTRMSTFTTYIQHSIGSPSHSNQTRKRNKRHPNWKGRNKTVTADDMIVYIKSPIDSTKKLLDLINEFGKTGEYKVNTQKSKAFLYTNNETAETEIGKKSHLI